MEVLVLLVLALFCTSIAGEWPVPGVLKSLAGNYDTIGYANGLGAYAKFHWPRGMALDPTTGNLFVGDFGNLCVRVISPSGNVSTLGNQLPPSNSPYGLAFNEADRVLYVGVGSSDITGYILQINVDTSATSIILQSGTIINDDPAHPIKNPQAIMYDSNKKFLFFSEWTSALRVWPYPFVSPSTTIQTLYIGNGGSWNFVRDSNYNSYMGVGNQLMKIPAVGPSRVLAGSSSGGYVNGPSTSSRFQAVEGLAWSADKDFIYVADNGNGVIRKVLLTGYTSTVAGIAATDTFAPGPTTIPGTGGTFYHASEIYAHPIATNFFYVADQSGIRIWYGAAPNISNLVITPNFAVPNGIFIDATALVPMAAITEFLIILEAQGEPQETHSTSLLPYTVVPQHINAAYMISIFPLNEYGSGNELYSKYHS